MIVMPHAKFQINVLIFVSGWKWQSEIKRHVNCQFLWKKTLREEKAYQLWCLQGHKSFWYKDSLTLLEIKEICGSELKIHEPLRLLLYQENLPNLCWKMPNNFFLIHPTGFNGKYVKKILLRSASWEQTSC